MMSVLYFLLGGVAAVTIWQVFLIRARTRGSDGALRWAEEESSSDEAEDLLAVELGARIFSPEDSRLIDAETSPQFSDWFDSERRALALNWLDQVRGRVREIVREHRHAASQNPAVRPADEIKLGFGFFLFELTSQILYCLICLRGPRHVSTLVGSFLGAAGKLRTIVQGAMPAKVSVEIVKN
jgi:hypothetical protein